MAAADNAILVDTSGGAVVLTLPAPTNGRVLKVKDVAGSAATNNITINPHSGETIDGGSSLVIADNWGSVDLISDGTDWYLNKYYQYASGSVDGILKSADWTTFNNKQPAGSYITALTGDVTASGPGSAAATIAANAVTNSKLAQMPTMTIKGNNTGGTANASDLTASQVNTLLGTITALTGDVSASGPGSAAATVNSVGGSSAANIHSAELAANAATDANTASTIIKRDASGNAKVSDPLVASDIATKGYVDTWYALNVSWKQPIVAASTSNLNLSSMPASVDGTTLSNGDRFLAKDQSTASQNGLYVFNGAGSAATRSSDMNTWSQVPGAAVILDTQGTVNTAGEGFVCTSGPGGTIGTTSITFIMVFPSSGGTVTSVALSLPVSVFSVSGSPVTSSGTLTGSFVNQSANTVFAGPTSGGSATPAFRALVAADIPSLSYVNTVGTYDSLSAVANGAQISGGNTIVFQSADATHPGMVSTGSQTLAGDKTLNGNTVIAASTASVGKIGNVGSSAQHEINGGLKITTNTVSSNYSIV